MVEGVKEGSLIIKKEVSKWRNFFDIFGATGTSSVRPNEIVVFCKQRTCLRQGWWQGFHRRSKDRVLYPIA